ncbi:MAG: DinB family protein [Cyclobacteriaceae bacterium]
MKNLLLTVILYAFIQSDLNAQYAIKNLDGYTPQLGALVSMMDDLKARVTSRVKNLDQDGTDFLLDEDANRIGALILHLAATEFVWQEMTFYDKEYDEIDDESWLMPMNLGDKAREELVGKPISFYLDKWTEVRAKSKEVLKTKNDEWLLQLREDPDNPDTEYNYYWAWYHVMEHQANHMGQIALIMKRIGDD